MLGRFKRSKELSSAGDQGQKRVFATGAGWRSRLPGRNVVMLGLSVALGGAGIMLSKSYIQEQIDSIRAKYENTAPMGTVVVASRRLMPGEFLTDTMIAAREMPLEYIDSHALNQNNYSTALGRRVGFEVDPGTPLLWAHLEGGLSPTFSGKVPEGLRAMTIRVDEINSISGFLQPRDRIDLLLSLGSGLDNRIMPFIQNLDVIATGEQTLIDKSGRASKRSFNTITVQITPDQAKRITLAQQVGKLTAMLRNPDDESPLSDEVMSVAQLLGIEEPSIPPVQPESVPAEPGPAARRTPRPRVEFIIGGS